MNESITRRNGKPLCSGDHQTHPAAMSPCVIGDDYLLGFVQGTLDPAEALLVATHCCLSPEAKQRLRRLADCAAASLEQVEPKTMKCSAQAFFEEKCTNPCEEKKAAQPVKPCAVPKPLQPFLGEQYQPQRWRPKHKGIKEKPLALNGSTLSASVYWLEKDAMAPIHAHTGDDMVLVLCGSLSDNGQVYSRGEVGFYQADPEKYHTVRAIEDCICLSVLHAPIRFRTFWKNVVRLFTGRR